jgi:ribosomal protein S18 acetylase RimI-like enzyme
MLDLLVRLYELPEKSKSTGNGFGVRRAFAAEKGIVSEFARQHFSAGWTSECEVAFARMPIACFIAVEADTIAGFACYDVAARGLFGPIGVAEQQRNNGLGSALLLAALRDMSAQGYAYAIIGRVPDAEFYRRNLNIIEIPESDPGFYRGLLKSQ